MTLRKDYLEVCVSWGLTHCGGRVCLLALTLVIEMSPLHQGPVELTVSAPNTTIVPVIGSLGLGTCIPRVVFFIFKSLKIVYHSG